MENTMKNKFDVSCLNFSPSGRYNQISYLLDGEELSSSLLNYNFQDEGSEETQQIIRSNERIKDKISEAIADSLIETQIELAEKWEMYVYLMNSGLTTDVFPFKEWDVEIKNIEDGTRDVVHIEMDDILEGVNLAGNSPNPEISKLAFLNLKAFLGTNLDKNFQNRKYFKLLEYTLSDNKYIAAKNNYHNEFNYIIDDLISHSNLDDDSSSKVRLIRFASRIIRIKSRPKAKFGKVKKEIGAEEKNRYDKEELKTDLISFLGSELWMKISSNEEYVNKFVEELTIPNRDFNMFCSVGANQSGDRLIVNSYKIDNITLFFDEVVKEDKNLAEKVLNGMEKYTPPALKDEYETIKLRANNIVTYHELNKSTQTITPKPIPPWLKI